MTVAPVAPALAHADPGVSTFRESVLAGLRRRSRRLPCKYFYDEQGSRLFDRICELPEYYLTRTELAILGRHGAEIARQLGRCCLLVELGSGSSRKTRILLDQLVEPVGYVPIDISCEHLHQTTAALATDYPDLTVMPVCADYGGRETISLPEIADAPPTTVFFPGSSIGNFHPAEARKLLVRIAGLCGPGGRLLIGIDLKKEPKSIERAYNDAQGVTAEFNRNLLRRVNRELGGDFAPEDWHHHAFYEPVAGRIEMHLVSRVRQAVRVGDETFEFDEGESIRTECSYKYTIPGFLEMANGFCLESEWTDSERRFAVLLLRTDAGGTGEVSDV